MSASGRPGKEKRRGRRSAKGRQPVPALVAELDDLLGPGPFRPDLLLEHLHKVHDHYHHISAAHIAALGALLNRPMAEVYEVASFYAHFDIVKEGEAPPPSLTVRVCDGLSCELRGAVRLCDDLRDLEPGVRVVRAPCMGRCDHAPVAAVGHNHVMRASAPLVKQVVAADGTSPPPLGLPSLAQYQGGGGFAVLRACLSGARTVEDVITTVEASGLRGLGGAGFPAGRKWRLVRERAGPRYLVVNADEGEPGTFKDRYVLETDPFRFFEGLLIAASAVDADAIYIYLRDEYPHLHRSLPGAIGALSALGFSIPPIHLRRGAGAYICGEESAMLESLEGKRGLPRHRPPYAAEAGLFGCPTLIHNVETLFFVRDILEHGPEWYANQGRRGRRGARLFSVSGRVREPGVKLAPAGVTTRELIEEFSGGMAEGHVLRAYLPGGASGGILPASMAGLPLDFDTLDEYGCFIGSAGIVVLSDQDDVAHAVLGLLRFFADESCGQCTPCRVGTEKAVAMMESGDWDAAAMEDLCHVMTDASICGLGQAAPNPIRSLYRFFPETAP